MINNTVASSLESDFVMYDFKNPKIEPTVPDEYVREILLAGDNFSYRKRKIYDIFSTISCANERAKKIRYVYGDGGAGWPATYGLNNYTSSSKGITFQWRENDGEHLGCLSWNAVEQELNAYILAGNYYYPPKKYDIHTAPASLWQEPLDDFFNNGFFLKSPYIILKEIFSKNYPNSIKTHFVARLYSTCYHDIYARRGYKNKYGKCEVLCHEEGISVEFYDEYETPWIIYLDWQDCVSYLESMIASGIYYASEEREFILRESNTIMRAVIEDYNNFLSGTVEDYLLHIVNNAKQILKNIYRDDIHVGWDIINDVLFIENGRTLLCGRSAYDYIMNDCLNLNSFKHDKRIPYNDMIKFRLDAVSSVDLNKRDFVCRRVLDLDNDVCETVNNSHLLLCV